ncbi:hypothetical protein [Actinophytocola sediminis]
MYQQFAPQYRYPPPGPPPSTRALTVVKWITFGVSVLLTGLAVFWVMGLRRKVEFLEAAERKSIPMAEPDFVASAEGQVVIAATTLGVIALLGVSALLTGLGLRAARVLCVLLTLGPIGVVVYGVVDGGSGDLWALVLLVPFLALMLLWCLPAVTRGLAVKRARRAAPRGYDNGRPPSMGERPWS